MLHGRKAGWTKEGQREGRRERETNLALHSTCYRYLMLTPSLLPHLPFLQPDNPATFCGFPEFGLLPERLQSSSLVVPSRKNPKDDLQKTFRHSFPLGRLVHPGNPRQMDRQHRQPDKALKPRPPETAGGGNRCFCLRNTYVVAGCRLVQTHSSPQLGFVWPDSCFNI